MTARSPRRTAALGLASFVGLTLAGAAGIGIGWQVLGLPPQSRHGLIQPLPQLATGIVLVTLVIFASWLPLRRIEGRGLASIGLGRQGRTSSIGLGLLAGGLTPAVALGLLVWLGHGTVVVARPDLLAETIPMVVAVTLVSAWEEIALRGYFLQCLGRLTSPPTAAAISGLLFGLLHAGNPGANPLGLAITAVNGWLLGLLVIRSGSLWLASGYHAGWNLTAAIGFGTRDSGVLHRGAFATTTLTGPAWLAGGGYGFEASLLTGLIEILVLGGLLRYAGRSAFDSEAAVSFGRADSRPQA